LEYACKENALANNKPGRVCCAATQKKVTEVQKLIHKFGIKTDESTDCSNTKLLYAISSKKFILIDNE